MKLKVLSLIVCVFSLSAISHAGIEGTKRFTPVLDGVMSFGGGKQVSPKRDNRNPLQDHTLNRLCENGFSEAVYLYSTNSNKMKRDTSCSQGNLSYRQMNWKNSDSIMKRIYDIAMSSNRGPIYIHCWNGLHASNAIASMSLIQFCGWSNDQAKNYWLEHSGERSFSNFRSVGKRIRDFRANPAYVVPASVKNQICP